MDLMSAVRRVEMMEEQMVAPMEWLLAAEKAETWD